MLGQLWGQVEGCRSGRWEKVGRRKNVRKWVGNVEQITAAEGKKSGGEEEGRDRY